MGRHGDGIFGDEKSHSLIINDCELFYAKENIYPMATLVGYRNY
jgi:hypothetical protein